MTALASTNVVVAISSRDRDIMPAGPKKVQLADITFGNGSLTYPTGGVPLPAKGSFGFNKGIDFVAVEQPPANGFFYKYDRANHKLLILAQGFTTGGTAAGVAENGANVVDSAGAEGTPTIPNTVASTTYDMGPLKELPVAVAPASVTIRMMMVGE
jgi:hypothetical protein